MAELAADLSRPYSTVAAWKARNRIPAEYDREIIAAAAKRGAVLTYEQLAMARSKRASVSPSEDAA